MHSFIPLASYLFHISFHPDKESKANHVLPAEHKKRHRVHPRETKRSVQWASILGLEGPPAIGGWLLAILSCGVPSSRRCTMAMPGSKTLLATASFGFFTFVRADEHKSLWLTSGYGHQACLSVGVSPVSALPTTLPLPPLQRLTIHSSWREFNLVVCRFAATLKGNILTLWKLSCINL